MAEQQLQLGNVEQLDGAGNPAKTDEALYQQSLEAPLPEAEFTDYLDGSVDVSTDFTMLDDLLPGVPPTDGQLQGAAEQFNMAMAANARAITPDDVNDMVARDIGQFDVQQVLAGLSTQSAEQRRLTAYNLIGDPRLEINAKMDLLRYVDEQGRQEDVNIVNKNAQSRASTTDYANDDEPDSQDAWAMQQEAVTMQPAMLEPAKDDMGNVQAPEGVYKDLQELYKASDESESFLDYVEQMTPVGSLPTLNAVVADIYSDLGIIQTTGDAARPWLTVGNSFAELRGMIRAANPEQKAQIAKVVYDRLKQNTGMLQDTNDLVAMQVIQNLFPQEVLGSNPYAVQETEKTPQQEAARLQEIARLDARIAKFGQQVTTSDLISGEGPPSPEELQQLQARRAELINQTPGTPSGSTIADNVFNILDLTAIGPLLHGTGKVARKLPRLLEGLSHTAPETAARQAAGAVLDESGAAAARLGMRPIDLAENFLPTGADDVVLNRGVNGFAAMTETMREQVRALVAQVQPTNLTAAERGKALADISAKYDPQILAKTRSVKLHLNQSAVQLSEDGASASITAVFGATPYRGYATVRSARQASRSAIEEVFGANAPIELVQKQADGTFKIIPEGTKGTERGEFFLRVRDNRSLASSETYGTIGLADDAVDKLTLSSGAAHWTRGLNIFNDFHYDQISARVRQSSFSNTAWRGLLKPLIGLKTSEKQLLSKVIRENEGKVLSPDELDMAAGGNAKVIQGYQTFNQVGNIAYALEDQLKRTAYLREGLQDLYQSGQRIGFGKVMDAADAARPLPGGKARKVFDPSTGQYSSLLPADIEALYKKGGSLARMKHPVRGQENIEDALVVLDRAKGGKNLPIPVTGVQARIPGYYPHLYNRNFIVYAVDAAGKRVPKAVSFTAKSAAEYVERKNAQLAAMQKQGKAISTVRYEQAFDSALTKGDIYAQHLDEVESGFSQIMFGVRDGSPLKQLDNWMEEAELDPVAAMLRATEILSTRVTKGEMLQSMRQRVWNSLHLPENRKYLKPGAQHKSANQLQVEDLVSAHPDQAGWKRHEAMLHRIRLMEQSPDFWETQTKSAYRGMAQLSQKLGFKGAEAGSYRLAKSGPNPVSIGLAWLHRMYISAFATKQLVLQVLQSTATAGLLSPHRYAQSVYQSMAIIPAVILKTGALHGNKVPGFSIDMLKSDDFYGKVIGMEQDEFNRVVDIIIQRGLIDSVGSNTMVKAAIGDAADAAARKRAALPRKGVAEAIEGVRDSLGPLAPLTRVRTYDQAIFGTLNKLGWEGGERINQILSFLTLYNRDKAAGLAKLKDAAYVDSLIGRTAEITGNMVKEAGFGYTNSVLKPFMLWVPFQHKMILQALPKRVGGMQRFSADEKARMVMGQFLLYGANATAVTAGVHQLIERGIVERLEAAPEGDKNSFVQFWRDPTSKQVLEGLVFDWTGNKVMQALWGNDASDPKDMAWGRAFAPGAGHEFVREKVVAMASADWKGALGVQGNYYSKLGSFLNDISNVVTARMKDMDDVPLKERMGQMTQRGLVDLVPIYGKWATARWAVQHGQFIAQNGTLSEPFGDAIEAKLQFLLGIESKDRAAYYEAVDRLRLDFEDSDKATKAGDEIADIYWKRLVDQSIKLKVEAPTDAAYDNAMNQWMLDQGLMLSVLGPRELEVFNSRIERNMDRLASGNGDSAEMQMMEKFTNKLREGGYGEKGPVAAVYFRHLPFVQNNPAFMDMIESAWEDIAYEPMPENITEKTLEGEQ